ncbi:putative membrane protein YkoI [Spinactinospora alkalitolerans]|uniref:Putative membrane protein YkoI n=1 Tax=Spinactinospora alkalitolerans TaxID=687207 RepID=A0A852TQT9_9ACTN|nr:PepSY domain-containing protein [Spinactinospora alkalitolerans]NYE46349.1 putative membrane protein YkoI [Spinactinospora alkalitolerans]
MRGFGAAGGPGRVVAGMAVVMLALVSGCGRPPAYPEGVEITEQPGEPALEEGDDPANPEIDILAAADMAGEQVPEGVLYDIELEHGREWHVDLMVGDRSREVVIDSANGNITEGSGQGAPVSEPFDTAPPVSLEEAVDTALTETGGKLSNEANLAFEEGRTTWEVHVDDARVVSLDADSGEVVDIDG